MSIMSTAPRETSLESGGCIKGVATAVVTQNKDPDGLCRVKVSFPWHDQPRESYWARLATPMAGKNRGMVCIPEVGDEVLVVFEREDLRFPFVLGGVWNGKGKPPYGNKDGNNDIRVFRSRKGHKLTFDDGTRGSVQLELNDGKKLRLDDDGVLVDDGKGNKIEIKSNSGSVSVEAAGPLKLKGATVSIEATGQLEMKASGAATLRGSIVNIN